MFFVDGHCDTLSKALDEGKSLEINNLQVSFDMIRKNGGGIQLMACFIAPDFIEEKEGGFIRCNNIIDKIKKYETENRVNIIIKNEQELCNTVSSKDTKVILSLENGSAISGKLENIEQLYNQGVRIMSVTWNDDNELGCGCKCESDSGLTKLGEKYVKRLDELRNRG